MSAVYDKSPRVGVAHIPGEAVAEWWPELRPFVERALEYEHEPFDAIDIFNKCRADYYMVLSIDVDDVLHGVAICEQRKAFNGWDLVVHSLAGDAIEVWIDTLFYSLVMLARSQNCNGIKLSGRPGWMRLLKRFGFEPVSHVLRVEVDDG